MKKTFLTFSIVCMMLFAYTKNAYSQSCCNANFTSVGLKNLTWKFFPADSSDQSSYSWKWEFGDGSFSSLPSPKHTYNKKGSFTVKLIKTRKTFVDGEYVTASCAISKPVMIQPIKIKPICQINFITSQSGNTVTITNESIVQPGEPIYKWNFGDGNTSTLKNPVHAYLKPGNYIIEVKVYTNIKGKLTEGCSETSNIIIAGKSECNAEFTYQRINNTVYFNSPLLKTGELNYWEFGDGIISYASNPNHTYANLGQYKVIHHFRKSYLSNYDSCQSVQFINITMDSTVTPIDSNHTPIDSTNICVAGFQYSLVGDSVIFDSYGSTGLHYWTTGDGESRYGSRISHLYTSPNTSYTVCHTRVMPLGDSCQQCQVINVSKPQVSPNPADGFINIVSTNETLINCTLYDLTGIVLASKNNIQSLQTTLPVQNVPAGYYTLSVVYGNYRTVTYTILVQH